MKKYSLFDVAIVHHIKECVIVCNYCVKKAIVNFENPKIEDICETRLHALRKNHVIQFYIGKYNKQFGMCEGVTRRARLAYLNASNNTNAFCLFLRKISSKSNQQGSEI